MFKRFDLVRIRTVKNVKWLSGPKARQATPNDIWTVVCGVGGSKILLLASQSTLIQIPESDIIKLGSYKLPSF